MTNDLIGILGKESPKPKKGGWATGKYSVICSKCKERFIGDKRARECADCAYGENEWDKRKSEFERAARLKGYSLNKEEIGRYEDTWLQEAWEIFSLIDIDNIRGDT